jgi:hypothetical protein
MARRATAIVVTAVLFGALGSPPAGADPVKVLGTKADEYNPAASDTHLSWNVWNGTTNIVYAKPFGGARMRVSASGWGGWNGAISGTKAIFQQYHHGKGVSDIYLFDLVTKKRTKLPSAVNTKRWEYGPGLSGTTVGFARWTGPEEIKLILFDRATKKTRTVVTVNGPRKSLDLGQINGTWVTYETWAWDKKDRVTSCNVYRYDIAARTTTKIPNPDARCQYGPSVDPAGTVYFARSGFGCGRNVSLRAYPVGGPASTLTSLASGRDLFSTYAFEPGTGTEVYYDPSRCTSEGGYGPADIYKVSAVSP